MASRKTKQLSVLIMSTTAFTVCFMICMMFAVIGIPIKQQLGLNETQFGILAAMPVWALYSVLLRRRPPELPGMQLVFIVSAIGLPILGGAYAIEWQVMPVAVPSWPAIAGVLYVALFASVAAFACWNAAVAMVGPNVAGFSIHLLPAFGAILAMLFLGERPEWFHLWGVIAILAGVALASIRGR